MHSLLRGLAVLVIAAAAVSAAAGARAQKNGPIAFASYLTGSAGQRAGIQRVDPSGAHLRRLTTSIEDTSPAWSPDGRRLAFRRGNVAGRLFVIGATGGRARAVGRAEVTGPGLSWSPSGKQILFPGKGGLWVVSASGAGLRRLVSAESAFEPSWSRTGRIAFVEGSRVYVAPASGKGPKPLTKTQSLVTEGAPKWSPDGKRLLYVEDDLSKPQTPTTRIKVVNGNGRSARTIATTQPHVARATWSPDGRLIAFTDVRNRVAGIYVVSSRGGRARRVLTGQFAEPAWGPASR